MRLANVILGLAVSVFCLVSTSSAAEPGWYGVVVARGAERQQIESTPIVARPNRPLHFYGNTVRREYYRGTPLPAPRDFTQGAAALMLRR